MKIKLIQKVAAVMSVVMLLGLVGCSNSNAVDPTNPSSGVPSQSTENKETTPEKKDPVTLEWWYRGNGVQQDTNMVEEAFNELLKTYPGMEHVSVNLNVFTGSEYSQAVSLAQSADEQIDLLSSVSLNFANEVTNGTYLALNDLLESYPDLKAELPDWLWDMGSVDGSVYIVPNYQQACNPTAIYTPKVYMDKYGDLEAMTKLFADPNATAAEKAEMLETYLKAVRDGEGVEKYGFFGCVDYLSFMDYNDRISGRFVKFEGSKKVEYSYMSEDAVTGYEVMADWYEKGYVPKDILTRDLNAYNDGATMMDAGAITWITDNMAGDAEESAEVMSVSCGFDVYAIPLHDHYYVTHSWAAGGTGITVKSKHPEEAMRLLELMHTEEGKELYNMIVFGLENVHYTKNADGTIKTLHYDDSQAGPDAPYGAMNWIMGNTFHSYINQGMSARANEIALEMNSDPNLVSSDIIGFVLDNSSIATEMSQCKAIWNEYRQALLYGAKGSGWKAYYDEFVAKMQSAGLQKCLDEIQAQLDAFYAK